MSRPRRNRRLLGVALVACVMASSAALAWGPVESIVESAALLDEVGGGGPSTPVVERTIRFDAGTRRVPMRLYSRPGGSDGPVLVIAHGVHHLGIEEPRLVRFARAFARRGFTVATPELAGLARFEIDPESTETIGYAVRAMQERTGGRPVGLMGLSFAGGLALRAAADPRFSDGVAFVVSVGGHHDLARVLRFFATNQAELPDGGTVAQRAHDYGAVVVVASNAEAFLPAADVAGARAALKAWLSEDQVRARAALAELSPATRELVEHLFRREIEPIAPRMLQAVAAAHDRTAAVSPAAVLSELRVPVLVLHGAGDTVIPASEAQWLARDIPRAQLRELLVSPALVHVELGEVTPHDRWALVRFVASMIRVARERAGSISRPEATATGPAPSPRPWLAQRGSRAAQALAPARPHYTRGPWLR